MWDLKLILLIKRLFVFLISAFSFFSHAQNTLSNVQLYQRCYSQLTGQSALTSSSLSKIQSGELKAIDACVQHLTSAQFGPDGNIVSNNDVSFHVLQQIHQIHRSWFKKSSLLDSEVNRDFHWATLNVYDVNEPALHFTRASLQPGIHISEAITRPVSIEARRSPAKPQFRYILADPATNTYQKQAHGLPRVTSFVNDDPLYDQNRVDFQLNNLTGEFFAGFFPLIQVGQIYGIQDRRQDLLVASLVINPNSEGEQLNPGNPPHNFPINKNYGAGLIGSIPYLITNLGHGYVYQANGAEKLSRKWSESIMKDLLCREIPVLRDEDIVQFVSTNPASPQFRQGRQCLTCHGTIDHMAMTTRNLKLSSSGNRQFNNDYATQYFATISSYTPIHGDHPEFWPQTSDGAFHLRSPKGRLYFRNYTGRLIDVPLNSIQDLGNTISSLDDYYVCLAKKYFQHFTGISVHIKDPAFRSDAFYSDPKFRELRDYVVDLGLDLKSHGSTKQTIGRILRSPYYSSPHYQTQKGGSQ